jgi:hypothetical protein
MSLLVTNSFIVNIDTNSMAPGDRLNFESHNSGLDKLFLLSDRLKSIPDLLSDETLEKYPGKTIGALKKFTSILEELQSLGGTKLLEPQIQSALLKRSEDINLVMTSRKIPEIILGIQGIISELNEHLPAIKLEVSKMEQEYNISQSARTDFDASEFPYSLEKIKAGISVISDGFAVLKNFSEGKYKN